MQLLRELSDEDWQRPTACDGWTVRDIAAHLLADDFGRLSGGRDGFGRPWSYRSFDELVTKINRSNQQWVEVSRRLSPRLRTP